MSRLPTRSASLRRAGFGDVARAEALLRDPALADLLRADDDGAGHRGAGDGAVGDRGPTVDEGIAALVADLSLVADPDRALLMIVRIAGEAPGGVEALTGALAPASPARHRLLAVLGASSALGDELIRHPGIIGTLGGDGPSAATGAGERRDWPDGPCPDLSPNEVRDHLLWAVGAAPISAQVRSPVPEASDVVVAAGGGGSHVDALRVAYRSRLLQIAAHDLVAPDPTGVLDQVSAALADLAAAALEAALAIARATLDDHGVGVRFAIIGMGKSGGRELNYISDVDVIYVVAPAPGYDEAYALRVGAQLAAGITRVCSAPSGEPPLWTVDTALRPEGADGPIVRTLASHVAYYERWAHTWEFQALLRARALAGDVDLGRDYTRAVEPFVWAAAGRENFVADSQAMRARVEAHIPLAEADRELKLGKGGLRDIEFTIQLLQLVHGRTDETIRSEHTLTALADLSAGGYVGRADAARMAEHYRFLRVLEHRIQLDRMRRTHLLPTGEPELRRLARSVGIRTQGAGELLARVRATRREVRDLHETMFFRPLLPAVASLSPDQVALSPEKVTARLAAIGYGDPAGAVRHMRALTEGVSRRAAIQRQLLPVLLGWFAQGADPDGGLLGFRQLSDALGSTSWYLKMLRDSGSAAPRLALLLASSTYMVQALERSPESIKWLADDAELVALGRERLLGEARATAARTDDPHTAILIVRAMRRRELARTAATELLHISDPVSAAEAIATITDVTLIAALELAERIVATERGLADAPTRMLIVAMGRLGGREPGYGSDADVMFVHDPLPAAARASAGSVPQPAAGATSAQDYAHAVAVQVRSLLGSMGAEPALEVDADLRPEGRNGPLVRSIASYAEYYARWSHVWESQALLRARPVAGDPALAAAFVALIEPLRYRESLEESQVREIRRIKARVERERLPRAIAPIRHLKLGPGGIGDVEWTVQLLQLQHGFAHPSLRTTSTLDALDALASLSLIDEGDAEILRTAWLLSSGIRNALILWSGRSSGSASDVLPAGRHDLVGIARIMDYPAEAVGDLEEDYLRAARRARAVVERIFYGL